MLPFKLGFTVPFLGLQKGCLITSMGQETFLRIFNNLYATHPIVLPLHFTALHCTVLYCITANIIYQTFSYLITEDVYEYSL